MKKKVTKRTCKNGHSFLKSASCPVCPICEKEKENPFPFMAKLSAPAKRALIKNNITSVQQLSRFSVKELLSLHGLGPASIPVLELELKALKMNFKN